MTSKLRFLGDGTGEVYVKGYYSQLASTSSAHLGLLSPDVELSTTHFEPNPINLGGTSIGPLPPFSYLQKDD
jgi:hypothetical protein